MTPRKPNSIKLYSEELIDPEIEFHYAFHRSLKDITAIHTHNFFELFVIVRGELLHTVNGRTQTLSTGTLMFMRPRDVHYYQHSEGKGCHLINLAFRDATVKELFNYLGSGFPSESLVQRAMPARVMLSPAETEILAARLEHLNTIPRDQKHRIRSTLRILLFEMFTKYFFAESGEGDRRLPAWLEALIAEVQKKENFVLGIKSIYGFSRRTPEHISRVFRRYLGTTPTDYINQLRLHYAANLLSNSDDSVTYISMESGFENVSHFYHLFKRQFGVSPAEFRARTRKVAIPV
jgi:AraC family transcriptional regulator, dual regulator of chb operon